MKLLLVNPNTTESMTLAMQQVAEAYLFEQTNLQVCQSLQGPESIQGYYDAAVLCLVC